MESRVKQIGKYSAHFNVGEGSSASVYVGIDDEGRPVALKKFKNPVTIQPNYARKEVAILQAIPPHSHIIQLLDEAVHKNCACLIFEKMENDLYWAIRRAPLEEREVAYYMKQLLAGLRHLHANGIVHRDIKPSNILVSQCGEGEVTLKIADFGIAKDVRQGATFAKYEGTRYYKSPEVFYGMNQFQDCDHIDMWAAGCVLAELLTGRPLFEGTSELDQMNRITAAVGVPTEATWPGVANLSNYAEYMPEPTPLPELIVDRRNGVGVSATCMDLLTRMLTLNPSARIGAEEALAHPFFAQLAHGEPVLPADVWSTIPQRSKRKADARSTLSVMDSFKKLPSLPLDVSPARNRHLAIPLSFDSPGGDCTSSPCVLFDGVSSDISDFSLEDCRPARALEFEQNRSA